MLLRLVETDVFQLPQLHKHFNVVRNKPNYQIKANINAVFILSAIKLYAQSKIGRFYADYPGSKIELKQDAAFK